MLATNLRRGPQIDADYDGIGRQNPLRICVQPCNRRTAPHRLRRFYMGSVSSPPSSNGCLNLSVEGMFFKKIKKVMHPLNHQA